MQALFLTAPQLGSEHRSVPTDVVAAPPFRLRLAWQRQAGIETTGRSEERWRESAV